MEDRVCLYCHKTFTPPKRISKYCSKSCAGKAWRAKGKGIKDIKGQRFGRLVVLKFTGTSKHGVALWLCKCDCGNEKIILSCSLVQVNTKSCGCLKIETDRQRMTEMRAPYKLPEGEAAFNSLHLQYRRSAARRDLPFCLTKDEFKKLTRGDCYYCGKSPQQRTSKHRVNGSYIYNGIDRRDNDLGYTIDNCVPCCTLCNLKKLAMSEDEFITWVVSVYNHYVTKNAKAGIA